jgi:type IV pilus assembly protein PilX
MADMKRRISIRRHRENGVVLFISLVMLLIITVLGLSSVQSTSMQERMARNARDTNLAFQSAESAIKDAEAYVETLTALDGFPDNNNGLYLEANYGDASNWTTVNWDAGPGYRDADVTNIVGVATQPKYIVEFVKTVVSDVDRLNLDNIGQDTGSGQSHVFRITVFGTGGTDSARVMIQSTYGKRF